MHKSLKVKKVINDTCRGVANQSYLLGYCDATDDVYRVIRESTVSIDNRVERLVYWETLRSTSPFIFR